MAALAAWIEAAPPSPEAAFDAHFRLTAIHPCADGNGRTARLLMNLMLLRADYPPVSVRQVNRKAYLEALERASIKGEMLPFQHLLHQRLAATMDEYLAALREALPDGETPCVTA